MIQFDLTIPPSVNRLYRNVPGKGRVKTKEYRAWEKMAGWDIITQGRPTLEGPYVLSIRFRKTATGCDLGNLEKAVSDVMQVFGVIKNDRDCRKLILAWSDRLPEGVNCRVMVRAWTKD